MELRGATVRFGADAAIDGVDFRLFPGEVHSLMGENGAGKSTLIKAISGVHPLDEGVLLLDGREVRFTEPFDAIRAGISTVYQEIDLLPNISVAENIALGREPRAHGRIDWAAMRRQAHDVLADLGLPIDPASILGTHSVAVQQLVAIARAISADVKVLILDEPTSSLDADEVAELFRIVRGLADRGVAVVFISHFLEQVYELCDRVTVLRDGRLVGEFLIRELLRIDLVQAMLGRAAMRRGVVYSSENRRTEGIISDLSVQENIILALQAQRGALRKLSPARQRELAASWVEALDIRPPDLDRPAGTLSGGNQQKVMLARLLALSPRVIVLDEPTRGIDVGAKVEIQKLVGEFADNGLSVVFISAELEEVVRVAHRVIVLRDGRIVDTLPADGLSVDAVLALVAQPEDAE
ncbi:MAG: sugar ABC transporter ATP-binding protein [Microbacterium sp.]|nr:MAG: sugar ABC transporter ATP-binding protein [Microbacterium sp.]